MKRNNSQKGFTLIEAVVATGVFAFVVSSVIGIYLSVVQIDTRTRAERSVQQNARFIMDFLGKEIRNGRIDYDAYGGTISYLSDGYTTTLYLVNQLDEREAITCVGNNLVLTKTAGTTNLNSTNTSGTAGVVVNNCRFFISPATNPFELLASNPPNIQPSVTVVLGLSSNYSAKAIDIATINLESTYTVRDYPTREN